MCTLQYQKCTTVVYYALYYYTINNKGGDFFKCYLKDMWNQYVIRLHKQALKEFEKRQSKAIKYHIDICYNDNEVMRQ